MVTITLDGIQIKVQRKKMKHMTMRFCPLSGNVNISAPLRTSDISIRRFAATHIEWIQKNQLRHQQKSMQGRYFILGREYILRTHEGAKKSTVSICDDTYLDLFVSGESTPQRRDKVLNDFYKKHLHAQLETLVPYWEQIIGECASLYQIRLMKSRWGSCCPLKRKICLNLTLIKYPIVCLEYVLVHELVHLLEASHNAKFKALMDKFMPEWRMYKAMLDRF